MGGAFFDYQRIALDVAYCIKCARSLNGQYPCMHQFQFSMETFTPVNFKGSIQVN